jgi:hypothetical protein
MGQIESKIFEEAPPWDMESILSTTDLDKTAINLCWRNWSHRFKTIALLCRLFFVNY